MRHYFHDLLRKVCLQCQPLGDVVKFQGFTTLLSTAVNPSTEARTALNRIWDTARGRIQT